MSEIRVRFAPSPTGALHIGGARTALFNYLFARQHNGKFILRIEDTDISRSSTDASDGIIDGLTWLGLIWDEGPDIGGDSGPYLQSLRSNIYQRVIDELIKCDAAYYCFCTPDEIQAERMRAQTLKTNYKYSRKCCCLTETEKNHLLDKGIKPVLRLKVPESNYIIVCDLIRGQVRFDLDLIDDFIIVKSDGNPVYNLAVVIDDYYMMISHVIRAEEHLSNTPKQLLIYQALGWKPPHFAHVSMILAPDRSKLSKRHGATSIQEFRDQGLLPQAMLNYLALLGWSSGADTDIIHFDEILEKFDIKDVSHSAAIYDTAKLNWINGQYLNELELDELVSFLKPAAAEKGWLLADNNEFFVDVVSLVRSRSQTLVQMIASMDYFFEEISGYDPKGISKYFSSTDIIPSLETVRNKLLNISLFESAELESLIRSEANQMGLKAGDLIHPLRLAVTGRTATPGLFEIMELLGRGKCCDRIANAILYIREILPN